MPHSPKLETIISATMIYETDGNTGTLFGLLSRNKFRSEVGAVRLTTSFKDLQDDFCYPCKTDMKQNGLRNITALRIARLSMNKILR